MFDMSRQQQLIDHEKDDQRRHSIIGKAFPCFGESEIQKTLGMTQEGRAASARRSCCARSHPVVLAFHLRGTLTEIEAGDAVLFWQLDGRRQKLRARI